MEEEQKEEQDREVRERERDGAQRAERRHCT
jgi:hypothetical protein